jgi:hypothetical protein
MSETNIKAVNIPVHEEMILFLKGTVAQDLTQRGPG